MAKLRINMLCSVTEYSAKWVIDLNQEAWDVARSETVEIDVNEFKKLAQSTNCKYELAQLVMDHMEEEKEKQEYNSFIQDVIKQCWME